MWYRVIFKLCRGMLYFTFFFAMAFTFHSCYQTEMFGEKYLTNTRQGYLDLIRKENGCHISGSVVRPIKSCGSKEGTTTPGGFEIPVLEEGKYYIEIKTKDGRYEYVEIPRDWYYKEYNRPGITFLLFGIMFFFAISTNMFGKIYDEENFSVKAHFKHLLDIYFRGEND